MPSSHCVSSSGSSGSQVPPSTPSGEVAPGRVACACAGGLCATLPGPPLSSFLGHLPQQAGRDHSEIGRVLGLGPLSTESGEVGELARSEGALGWAAQCHCGGFVCDIAGTGSWLWCDLARTPSGPRSSAHLPQQAGREHSELGRGPLGALFLGYLSKKVGREHS
jgi:hypothetical protein